MINTAQEINLLLQKYHTTFADVVSFNPSEEHFINLDFTANNQDLLPETVNNTHKFSEYIDGVLSKSNAKFGIGGYFEHRTIYARSEHFGNSEEEPRRLHLGVDIWGKVNTPVFAFADAQVQPMPAAGAQPHFVQHLVVEGVGEVVLGVQPAGRGCDAADPRMLGHGGRQGHRRAADIHRGAGRQARARQNRDHGGRLDLFHRSLSLELTTKLGCE